MGNNDPKNAFVQESMGTREMIPTLGTCHDSVDDRSTTYES